MREILTYTAIIVLLALTVVYRSDYVAVETTELQLKNDISNAARGAAMLLDKEAYADGYVVFDDAKIENYVQNSIDGKCDKYKLEIFDHSGKHRTYNKDGFINEESFSFPYFYTDPQGMKTKVVHPSIIIEGQISKEFYRISELQNKKKKIVRSTMYVLEARDVS